MAENTENKLIVSIGADTTEFDQALDQTKQKLNEVNNTPADGSVKSLKQQVREATNEAMKMAAQFGNNSKQFQEAAKRVAELRDRFQEAKQVVDAFNPDNKLQSLASLAKGATGAIQGVTGAMAFMGVESDDATKVIARLQGLMNFSQALNSIDDIKNSFSNFKTVLGLTQTAAEGSTAAVEGQTAATEGATVATRGFGMAFKAIGIGLIVAAIAALWENWDKVTAAIEKVFPALKTAGNLFDKVKQYAMGVGNAITKFVTQPFVALVKLFTDGPKAAMAELSKSIDVVQNFKEGAEAEAHSQDLDNTLKRNKEKIEVLKAGGKETYELEKENFKIRREQADGNQKELDKINQEEAVANAAHNKKLEDQAKQATEKQKAEHDKKLSQQRAYNEKMAALLKSEEEKLKAHEGELQRIIDEATKEAAKAKLDDRSKELLDNQFKFDQERKDVQKKYDEDLGILQAQLKRKAITQEQFNQKVLDLNTKNEEANASLMGQWNAKNLETNTKYNKQIQDLLDSYMQTEYQKRKAKIEKDFDDAIKLATDPQKIEELKKAREKALGDEGNKETSRKNVLINETNYIKTITDNTPNEADSAEVAVQKENNIYQALRSKRIADFNDKMLQIQNDEEAKKLLKEQYRAQDEADEQAHSKRKVEIWQQEADRKRELESLKIQAVTTAFGIAEQFAGKNKTLANTMFILQKAIAIAEIVVNTQKEIAGYWANPTWSLSPDGGAAIKTAMSTKAKIRAGISIATIAASTLSKFIGQANSGGGGSEAPQVQQAPSISATNLQVQPVEVRATNQPYTVVKAYITDRDLKDHEAKSNFLNNLQTI